MRKTPSLSIMAALVATLAAAPASAQQTAQPDKEAAHVRELIQQAMRQMPTPAIGAGQASTAGPRVDLGIEDAVQRAMERNLTLASERLTPRTFDYSIAAAWANYKPIFGSTLSNRSSVNLPTSVFSGGSRFTQDTQTWNANITQNLPWYGGNYQLGFNNSRAFSDAVDTTFNPNFTTTLQATYTQPLWRDFRTDNSRVQLKTTQLNQKVSEISLSATAASTVAQVRNAYWELVYAYQAVDAAQLSLDLATKLVLDNQSKVEIGTMAPIDVVQAQAEQATRRQQFVNAEATLRNNELALKRLIVSGTDDELWRATINPTDRPGVPTTAEPIDLEGAVRNALSARTDIQTSRENLAIANLNVEGLTNQARPQLNLVATYSLLGRGGTQYQRNRIDNAILATVPGGYTNALTSISGLDAPTWLVQMNFSYPIGQSAAEANLARQKLLIEQNQATIKATELQIATDVTSAALTVRNTLESVQAAGTSRELSEKRLVAVQSKFDVGMSTNYEVVQAQRDLNDARNSELRALLNYRKALVDFQRVQISPR